MFWPELRSLLLVLLSLFTLGCGDSESFVPAGHPENADRGSAGTVLVQATLLERAVPVEVTRWVFSGLDNAGAIVYGPISVAAAAEMRLEDVPIEVGRISYVLMAGDEVFGFGSVSVEILVNQETIVEDPPFELLSGPVERLDISPADAVTPLGREVRYVATATLSSGEQQEVTTLVAWSSQSPSVATISNQDGSRGLASATNQGVTRIVGTLSTSFGQVEGSTSLQVVDAVPVDLTVVTADGGAAAVGQGVGLPLQARVRYSNGLLVTESAQWLSLAPAVAGVGSDGLVTGIASGSAVIRASFGGLSGDLEVAVTDAALLSLEISPDEFLLASGGTQALRAYGVYQDGSRRELTDAVVWSSGDVSVAAVTPSGLVLAQGQSGDTVDITAALAGLEAVSAGTVRQDLYMTDTTSGIVHQPINDDESLPPMSQSKHQAGTDYQELEMHPAGTHLFALTDDGRVQAFSISPGDGSLSLLSSQPTSILSSAFTDRVSLKAHPSGRLLYLCAQVSSRIEAFAFDPQNADLTPLGEVASAASPLFGLAIEPEGQYLYALRPAGAELLGFAIAPETGQLSALGTTALPASVDDATCIATAKRETPIVYLAGDTLLDGFRIGPDGSLSAAPIIPIGATDQRAPNRLLIRNNGTAYQLVSLLATEHGPIWKLAILVSGTITGTGAASSFGVSSFGLAFSSSGRTAYRQTNAGLLQWIPPGFELAPFSVPGPTARSLVATP